MRAAKPGLKTAAVYLWEPDDDDPMKLVRTTVTQREKADIIDMYSSNEMKFFPAQNTWHVCADLVMQEFRFSTGDEEDDDDDEYYSYADEQPPPPFDHPVENVRQTCPVEESTLATERFQAIESSSEESRYEELFARITRDVRENFGFSCPIPLPPAPSTIPREKDAALFLRSVGWCYRRNEKDADRFMRTSVGGCIHELYKCFVGEGTTSTTPLFDLNPTCPQPLAVQTDTLEYLSVLERGNGEPRLYMFTLHDRNPVAVYSPIAALAVCRRRPKDNEDLCRFLYDIGARFQTFIDSPSKWQGQPHGFQFTLPERDADFVYDGAEYANYIDSMHSLLKMTRMRAAALRGGYIWRLCCNLVRHDHVLEGPSRTSLLSFTHGDAHYYDDQLTVSEEQMIVGTYSVPDGRGKMMHVSWWPPPDLWDDRRTGENYTFWTEFNERGYEDRLKKIHEGKARPLSRLQWAKNIRGGRHARKWHEALVKRSEEYIQDLIDAR